MFPANQLSSSGLAGLAPGQAPALANLQSMPLGQTMQKQAKPQAQIPTDLAAVMALAKQMTPQGTPTVAAQLAQAAQAQQAQAAAVPPEMPQSLAEFMGAVRPGVRAASEDSVKQQLLAQLQQAQQSQQGQGLPGLASGLPTQMAEGGVVGFNGEGDSQEVPDPNKRPVPYLTWREAHPTLAGVVDWLDALPSSTKQANRPPFGSKNAFADAAPAVAVPQADTTTPQEDSPTAEAWRSGAGRGQDTVSAGTGRAAFSAPKARSSAASATAAPAAAQGTPSGAYSEPPAGTPLADLYSLLKTAVARKEPEPTKPLTPEEEYARNVRALQLAGARIPGELEKEQTQSAREQFAQLMAEKRRLAQEAKEAGVYSVLGGGTFAGLGERYGRQQQANVAAQSALADLQATQAAKLDQLSAVENEVRKQFALGNVKAAQAAQDKYDELKASIYKDWAGLAGHGITAASAAYTAQQLLPIHRMQAEAELRRAQAAEAGVPSRAEANEIKRMAVLQHIAANVNTSPGLKSIAESIEYRSGQPAAEARYNALQKKLWDIEMARLVANSGGISGLPYSREQDISAATAAIKGP